MSKTEVALCKVLNELTGDTDFFSNFERDYRKRLIAQKVVYLLQRRADVNLSYPFGWYLAGPYCPSLAQELYEMAKNHELLSKMAREVRFTEEAANKVRKVQSLVNWNFRKLNLELHQWLELLASVDYVSIRRATPLTEVDTLTGKLLNAKPKFNKTQVGEAIRCLSAEVN